MAKAGGREAAGDEAGASGLNRYTLLGRVRNEVQEVSVESSLDREAMKEAIAATLASFSRVMA
jgi:hypothetical protein